MLRVGSELLAAALTEGEEQAPPYREAIAAADLAWLRANIPDPAYVDFLVVNGVNWAKQACCQNFFGARLIVENTMMWRTIAAAFVVVGTAASGDFIAIPRKTWDSIGYISAGRFGYDRDSRVPYVQAAAESVGHFFYASWHLDGFPCDYEEAVRNPPSAKGPTKPES